MAAADLVFTGGTVYTADAARPRASALAVRDGEIVFVGDAAEARDWVGGGTERVDLGGRMLMPGIHDGHLHPLMGGQQLEQPSLDYERLRDDEFRAAIRRLLDEDGAAGRDGWLNVAAWEPQAMSALPTRQDLDGFETERPIVVTDASGHTSVANSRALELSGVTAATSDPEGGRIVRGTDGEPTGQLFDEAIFLVLDRIPATADQNRRALRAAHELLASRGVTSYLDVWAKLPELEATAALSDAGESLIRVWQCASVTPEEAEDTELMLRGVQEQRAVHARSDAPVSAVKLFMDGVIEYPTQTAALLEPYLDGAGEPTGDRGPTYFSQDLADRTVAALDDAGWQVHMHAIGDRAVRSSLDAIAFARERNGDKGLRHTIAHLQLVDPADWGRFRELDAMASVQAQWARRDAYTVESLLPYVGERRWRHTYPIRSLKDAGAMVCGGSDWPVDPLEPFRQVQTAVTRTTPEAEAAGEPPLFAEEAISLEDSLRVHTANAAHQLHREAATGALREGFRADVIVLDRDLFEIPITEVAETRVLLTAVDGKVVHRSAELG